MIHKIQITILFILLPFGGLYLYAKSQHISMLEIFSARTPIGYLGEVPVKIIEVADTPKKRAQGLSGRKELGGTEGMLFIFETLDYHGMWMKGMNFPIDIIWIDDEFTIVSIDSAVRPETYPHTYRPARPARYVIETNARYTDTFNIAPGDVVKLPYQIMFP